MKEKCIKVNEIATILALDPEDPRRRHLDECPRCASRLLLYQRFLTAGEASGADADAADAHLAEVMKSAIDRADISNEVPESNGLLERIVKGMFTRPVWATAAVVLVAAVALVWWQPWKEDGIVLRSDMASLPGAPHLSLGPVEALADGGMRLTWTPVEGAEGYVIKIRTSDLAEIARFGPVADTSFVIYRSMLPPEAPPVVLWRVVALRYGDEIGRSRPASLELP
jgi:hypothetical protein